MCTEPLYALRLKDEYDVKFQKFGKHSKLIFLGSVRKLGEINNISYNKVNYDLLMIPCGQCMQCRLIKSQQRAVMSVAEASQHKDSLFLTLTFGYPQLYSYFRHTKNMSHYLASKFAHFYEWSLDTEFFQKFMKRLRNWFYNYQLCNFLIDNGFERFVPSNFYKDFYVTHVYLDDSTKQFVNDNFVPNSIRFQHSGEYGSKRMRPHHHSICFGLSLPDLEVYYEDGKKYFRSNIISKLWPFGIHCIGDVTYNSCAYVARYVTKKYTFSGTDDFYNGRKPEYSSYSTKPSLGFNYFKNNYSEFLNNSSFYVVSDKKYSCPIPKSFIDNVKKFDLDSYNSYKSTSLDNCLRDLSNLSNQNRSIYSKLDSNQKISFSIFNKLVRSFESSVHITPNQLLSKAKAFGVSTKFFSDPDFYSNAINFLKFKNYRSFINKSSNQAILDNYYDFNKFKLRLINSTFNVNFDSNTFYTLYNNYSNMINPYKCNNRGKKLPCCEALNENTYIDSGGNEYEF